MILVMKLLGATARRGGGPGAVTGLVTVFAICFQSAGKAKIRKLYPSKRG